ncbi:hypothetical protein [Nitratifractor sp.]
MKGLLKAILFVTALGTSSWAGMLHLDTDCPPKLQKMRIYIEEAGKGKPLIDHTIENPRDKTPIVLRLDFTKQYGYRIETFPPGIQCYFRGAKGSKLPPDPDIVCECLQNVDHNRTSGSVNLRPGKWKTWGGLETLAPLVYKGPVQVAVHCVRNPAQFFSVRRLGAILDTQCPYTKIVQTYDYGEWVRKGPICGTIHGRVDYLGDRLEEVIDYYAGPNQRAKVTTHGIRLGDCP